jgi:uncharacterized membrane protein YccC
VATAAITVMALTCFNLIGDGFVLIVPRMVDTLLGCAIAAAAAFLILPDWQGRRLHLVTATCLDLRALSGFGAGPVPQRHARRPGYRIARRDMHNADAALSVALSNMLREPGHCAAIWMPASASSPCPTRCSATCPRSARTALRWANTRTMH